MTSLNIRPNIWTQLSFTTNDFYLASGGEPYMTLLISLSQKDRVVYKYDKNYIYVFAIAGHYDRS